MTTSAFTHHSSAHPASRHLTAQLDREWATLRRCAPSIRRARSWVDRIDPSLGRHLAMTVDLDDIVAATQSHAGAVGDRLLRELIRLAGDDQLAGRLVVQRLLPGVLAGTKRYGGLCDHADPVSEAIGALWIAISSFDGGRRSGPVAASIISDTMFAAFRRRVRLRSADERPTAPHTFDDDAAPAEPSAFVELADIIGEARRSGVPTHDIELLRHLVRAESPGLVARQRQVTPRTVRNHRDRAIDHVRAAVGVAAAA